MIRIYGKNNDSREWNRLTPDLPDNEKDRAMEHYKSEWDQVQARKPYPRVGGGEGETVIDALPRPVTCTAE